MENMTLSRLLRRKMIDYGYGSLSELGKDLGVEASEVHYLMSGRVACPRVKTRLALCRVLDIAPEVLDRAIINGMRGG